MDMSIEGQMEMKKSISSRLSPELVEKLATILSSNCLENYFGVLVKFSQGKRINQDQTNSWCVLQVFVAGLRSNGNFTDEIHKPVGILPTKLRAHKRNFIVHYKQYN